MLHKSPSIFTPHANAAAALACAVLLGIAPQAAVRAAELGDVVVRSYVGQPLAADIELVSLAPDEVNALQVKLAQADVFRGANISMNPALATVQMTVLRREQRQYLHVTTTRPIAAEYVHLFVELSAAGRQEVRAATVWLQADPNPAPPPAPVVVAAAPATPSDAALIAARARAERAAVLPAPAPMPVPVAAEPAPVPARKPAPMPSLHESEVGRPGSLLKSTAPLRTPAREPISAPAREPAAARDAVRHAPETPAAADGSVPLMVAQALLPLPPLPLPSGIKRPAAPASCAPAGMRARECVALDQHGIALSSKLVELEGKVKQLQGALGGGAVPSAAPAASTAAKAAHATPAASSAPASSAVSGSAASSASSSALAATSSAASAASAAAVASSPAKTVRVLPKLKYKKEKPVEQGPSMTVLVAAGAGIVLVIAAGVYAYLRKKRGVNAPLKIWQGWRIKKPATPAEQSEPVLDPGQPA